MHEWLFWKLIFTPLEVFFKLPYPMIPIPEELDVVHEPNWEVLRSNKEKMGLEGEAKREEGSDGKGRMTWTWVRPRWLIRSLVNCLRRASRAGSLI
jgi:hypothetical protein